MGRRPGREPLRNRKTLVKRIRFRLCSRNSRQAKPSGSLSAGKDRAGSEKVRPDLKLPDSSVGISPGGAVACGGGFMKTGLLILAALAAFCAAAASARGGTL